MRCVLWNILWMLQNLYAGLRLVAFIPVSRDQFHVSVDQLMILLLPAIGATILTVYPFTGDHLSFSPDLWAIVLSRTFLALLLYYLISRFQRAPHSFPAVVIVIGTAAIALMLVHTVVDILLRYAITTVAADIWKKYWFFASFSLIAVMSLWALAVMMRSIRLVYTAGWLRAGLIGTVIVAASMGINWALPLFTWPTPSQAQAQERRADVEEQHGPRIDTERTYYAQSRLLTDHLASLAPAREGVGELYFVGFAGTSTQDVFLKEVRAAQALFDDRFDTRKRSLILVNNPQTIETLPVASITNLSWAMAGIANKMHVDDDILFLYMTSHGSPHEFSINFPELALNDLSDQKLRTILDRAGIKWRVIVISACYSGSFIDALKDDHTLILTAAAADRTSFGCGNEDDFTYFGDAFINQALRQDRSFIAAFANARNIIAAREAEEKKTPSNPQIYVGAAMPEKLRALEQRLAGAARDAGTQ